MTTINSTPEGFQKLREIYLEAVNLPASEQNEYLATACEGDPALEREIRELIALGELDEARVSDVIADVATRLTHSMDPEIVAETVGAYRILDTIGRGGMGRVYLAERSDGHFDQKVAIKLVDRSRMTPELVARFRSERQILASLDHPHIARLYDGGETEDGIPYLVMEYVEGIPIDRYCDEHRLPIRKRLELFTRVTEAVEYAHRNLVVHRDIKPPNILVTGDGTPKLLDFGIAKLLSRESIDYTMAVTVGDARLMTPRNASPEQVRGEVITTATDIYSLGLLLYELLTGRFPYETGNLAGYGLEKHICETEPTRPSAVVVQPEQDSGDAADTINTARCVPTTDQLRRQLTGDLDNIVLVAMRKEPERRYATVRQLAEDIQNYLEHRPVRARGESIGYRAAKFLRRNPGGVGFAAASVVIVSALVATYTYQLEVEAAKAREVASFMTTLFNEADPRQSNGSPVSVVEMLDRGAERANKELSDQPELQASLIATIGESYHNMWELTKAQAFLQESLPPLEESLGLDHPDVLRMRYFLGMSTAFLGDHEAALFLHEQNHVLLVDRHGRRSAEAATELHQIGFIHTEMANYELAEKTLVEVIDIFRGLGAEGRHGLATGLDMYGTLLKALDRVEEEAIAQLEALEIRRELYGERHPDYIFSLNSVATSLLSRGLLEESERYMREGIPLRREVFGQNSIPYGIALANLGNLLNTLGRYEEAQAQYDIAQPIFRDSYGEDHARYAYQHENIANNFQDMGEFARAESHFQTAMDILSAKFGAEHIEVAITRSNYGSLLNELERFDEAESELASVVAIMSREYGEVHNLTSFARRMLGRALHGLGRTEDAIEVMQVAIDALTPPPEHLQSNRLWLIDELARMRLDLGDLDAALAASADALAIWEGMGLLENPTEVRVDVTHASILRARGEHDAAEQHLRDRYDVFIEAFGEQDRNTVVLSTALAEF